MIEFHADDYGLTIAQSKRIIECIDNGVLNGISIMPNSPHIHDCMKLLGNRDVALTIHLNFFEGRALTANENSSKLITNSEGIFTPSFSKYLLFSFIPSLRKKYTEAFKAEILAQILAMSPYFESTIRLDSHCHYHMVPMIFDSLVSVIEENNISVSYIRVPIDNIKNYCSANSTAGMVKPINIIKVLLLNTLGLRNRIKHKDILSRMESKSFAGVLHSGLMNVKNSMPVIENALTNNVDFDILFHPGKIDVQEANTNITQKDDYNFLTSPNRDIEAQTLKLYKESLYNKK